MTDKISITPGQPNQYILSTTISRADWTPSVDFSGNAEVIQLNKRMEVIEKRLAIVLPDDELHKRYPALHEAYEYYKMIEKLVTTGEVK